MNRWALVLLTITTLTACHDNDSSSGNGELSVMCTDPRPQICTLEFDPVCGQLTNGQLQTFSTGCDACSNSTVIGYFEGACN